jgi:hypothetical protein
MATFAIVKNNGIVDNIIVADSLEDAQSVSGEGFEAIEYTAENGAHIGLSYDKTTGVFEQPQILAVEEVVNPVMPDKE